MKPKLLSQESGLQSLHTGLILKLFNCIIKIIIVALEIMLYKLNGFPFPQIFANNSFENSFLMKVVKHILTRVFII